MLYFLEIKYDNGLLNHNVATRTVMPAILSYLHTLKTMSMFYKYEAILANTVLMQAKNA